MLELWIGVSHRVGSALCYWNLSKKGKVLSHTTVQHLTADKPRVTNDKEMIHDYHGSLEGALVSDYFGTSLDGYNHFINDDEEVTAKGDPNDDK